MALCPRRLPRLIMASFPSYAVEPLPHVPVPERIVAFCYGRLLPTAWDFSFFAEFFRFFYTLSFLEISGRGEIRVRAAPRARTRVQRFLRGATRRGILGQRGLASGNRACRAQGQRIFRVVAGRLTQSVTQHEGRVRLRGASGPSRKVGQFPCCRRRRGKCFARSLLRETVGRRKVCWSASRLCREVVRCGRPPFASHVSLFDRLKGAGEAAGVTVHRSADYVSGTRPCADRTNRELSQIAGNRHTACAGYSPGL